jgi:hypothetical protein
VKINPLFSCTRPAAVTAKSFIVGANGCLKDWGHICGVLFNENTNFVAFCPWTNTNFVPFRPKTLRLELLFFPAVHSQKGKLKIKNKVFFVILNSHNSTKT